MKHALLLLLILPLSCSYFKRKGSWGKDALYPLRVSNFKRALIKNATDPFVWAPLVGAGVVHYGGYDRKIADWASGDSFIFRDEKAAEMYSNTLVDILAYEAFASVLLPPSWKGEGSWRDYTFRKVKGTVVTYIATTTAHSSATQIKNHVPRHRPNGGDHRSFPSGHATDAGGFHKVIYRNVNSSGLAGPAKASLNYFNIGLVSVASWARVEAGAHFPSDVLVGYAVGNFVSGFFYDSLMNLDENESFAFFPTFDGGASARYTFSF